MIQLRGINKTYFNGAPLHVLKGIDLDIEKGEMVSIMGASGSGKSTLLNILGILDTYDTGTYQLNGQLIQNLRKKSPTEPQMFFLKGWVVSFCMYFMESIRALYLLYIYSSELSKGVGRRESKRAKSFV